MSGVLEGLVLPESPEAERLLLGACLTDEHVAEMSVGLLIPSDFAAIRNQSIFTSLSDLHNRGIRVDTVTVANDLLSQNRLPREDGVSYLASLTDQMPKIAHVDNYVNIVREKSMLRSAIKQCAAVIDDCLTNAADSSELAARAERIVATFTRGDKSLRDKPRTIGQIVESYGGFVSFLERKTVNGFRIPIKILDGTLDGLRKKKLNVWAGRPGEGKTSLLIQCAESCADQGGNPLIISAEMDEVDLVTRSLCGRAKVSAYRFRNNNRLSQQDRLALSDELQAMLSYEERFLIYDRPDVNVQTIRYLLREQIALGQERDSLWVDYFQLLEALGQFRTRTEELGAIAKGFIAIKKEFEIPVTVLSQINREGDVKGSKNGKGGEEPFEKHIAESDKLVAAADLILMIWRSLKEMEIQAKNPTPIICMNWKVPKNRDGMKNRGGRNEDGNEQQPIYFNERQTRFVEDLDVNTPREYMEAA